MHYRRLPLRKKALEAHVRVQLEAKEQRISFAKARTLNLLKFFDNFCGIS